ncbi:DUF2147 domain-containing protein [Erythrobacter insulae]|uniref:DUF2147 domain-containing protein n=1 Tax=Erythrobacter insulae TaxID=2584124 RepID=A0A547PAI9_9SPHN|nr:DUF2147 domain-containing protein [Erythrobacter insulae]TRD11168.1 DUF2147 domain-containing protein [Erythrobacter insulae]
MITRALVSVASVAAAFTLGMSPAFAADPVNGRWITEDKDAVVTIQSCGAVTCGTISRFLVPPPDGPGQRDIYNPDPAKKKRKLLGLPILTQFKAEAAQWRGRIYDPKSGKSYRSILRRKDANTLEVKGCIGPFCQTQLWKRAK